MELPCLGLRDWDTVHKGCGNPLNIFQEIHLKLYKMWIIAFSAEYHFIGGVPTTTPTPLFELVILFRKHIFPASGPTTTITEEERSHESTLEEFLHMEHSPTICETLMSTMTFARTEADANQLSSMYLGPSIMHYAECNAMHVASIANLTKLKVEAVIIDDATPDAEGMDFIAPSTPHPQLYMIYQPVCSSLLHHSSLIMIDWTGSDDCCAVCLEEFVSSEKVARTQCQHYFHRHCIVKWLFQQGNCPICRNCDMVDPGSDSDADS